MWGCRGEDGERDGAMRVVLQRVTRASVTIDGQETAAIGRGYLLLVGFTQADTADAVAWMAEKIAHLRLFPDEAGRMNLSLDAVDGAVLVVSQFTLYGDARKGRRPSFVDAAGPDQAVPLYEAFLAALREQGLRVAAGVFGAMMAVELVNDGPVTLLLKR